MVKRFTPVFDTEDLTKLPNYQSIATVMINGVPSAPFSMTFLPPMNQKNVQLADAMKRLSATKYGFTRAVVEKEIFSRLEPPKPAAIVSPVSPQPLSGSAPSGATSKPSGGGSFLDEWLAKRQKMKTEPVQAPAPVAAPVIDTAAPVAPVPQTYPQGQWGGNGLQAQSNSVPASSAAAPAISEPSAPLQTPQEVPLLSRAPQDVMSPMPATVPGGTQHPATAPTAQPVAQPFVSTANLDEINSPQEGAPEVSVRLR